MEEAGPRVASCLVDLRHRCETLGATATVVSCVLVTGTDVDALELMSGSAAVEERKDETRFVERAGEKDDIGHAKMASRPMELIFICFR